MNTKSQRMEPNKVQYTNKFIQNSTGNCGEETISDEDSAILYTCTTIPPPLSPLISPSPPLSLPYCALFISVRLPWNLTSMYCSLQNLSCSKPLDRSQVMECTSLSFLLEQDVWPRPQHPLSLPLCYWIHTLHCSYHDYFLEILASAVKWAVPGQFQ